MPDRHDPKLSIRPPGERKPDEKLKASKPDDPLVELTRVVSRSGSTGEPPRIMPAAATSFSNARAAPLPSEADLARDLEAELLNELQASFSMVPEVAAQAPKRQDEAQPTAQPDEPRPDEGAPPKSSLPLEASRSPQAGDFETSSAASGRDADDEVLNDILSDFNDDILNFATRQNLETDQATLPPDPQLEPEVEPSVELRRPKAEQVAKEAPSPPPRPTRIKPPAPAPEKRESLAGRIARAAQIGGGDLSPAPANATGAPRPGKAPQRPATPPSPSTGERVFSDSSEFRPPSAVVRPPMPEPVNRTARQVETRWDMPSDTDGDSTFDPSRFAPLALDDEPDDGEMVADTTADEMLALPAETAFFEEGTAEDHYEEVPGYGDNNLLTYPDEELDAMQPRRSRKGVLAVAALVGVLVVGGVAVMLMRSSGSIGPPPIIVADASPTKITPENAAGGAGDSQSKLIYDRVDPDSEVADSQLVVSNDPEVAEIPPVPEEITSGDVSRVILGGGPGVDEQGDAPDVADGGTTPETGATSVAASSTGPAPIGPKKVRTVVVRPDGTIVSSEAVALEEEPTSAPPQADISGTLAEIPPASETPPAPAADENPLLSEDFGAEMTGDAAPEPVPYVASDSSASSSIPDISPGPAPASRPPASGSTVVATTGSSSGAAISPAPTAGRLGGGFLVQISSQRSEATALETFGELQRRYPSILGDRAPDIQRADLGERGIYYRVRVGYPTREEAVRMCENLKAAGGDCLLATR